MNAITMNDIFPLFKECKVWLGYQDFNRGMYFNVPNDYEYAETYKFDRERNGLKVMRVTSLCWFTNLPHDRKTTPIELTKTYDLTSYPKYDNYDAIEVSKVSDIPMDYSGVMGVPVTFVDKHCQDQFEIVGITSPRPKIDGKTIYCRILIRNKLPRPPCVSI